MPNPSVNSSVHSFVTSSESPSGSNLESTTPAMPPTPIPDRGVGLSDPDQSAGRRRMLELVNRMHNTGVQSDIDLPMIAVVGSQSAGKSSLIESISGITLPRASGTCTRCPTECRLSYSTQPWSCKVSLRKTFDEHGRPKGTAENIPFGPVIKDKQEVEERIRRAQRAILRPTKSAEVFLTGPDEDTDSPEITFSKNCVSLEINGPELTDLSFCDLPGLIVSVGTGGKASDIDLVKDLVTTYICKPSCLILLTVTCETDFENQGAHQIAKQHDPEGKRTIGVLTKPDRIPAGEEEAWLRFIRNEGEPLVNGWFTVKQPGSSEIKTGVTWAEARAQENHFFTTTTPWSSAETFCQRRFGTRNLTESLSKILSDLIKQRLPKLAEELQILLKETENRLRKLPKPPPENPVTEIIDLVSGFSRSLSTLVEGTPDERGIHQTIRPLHTKFRDAIRDTAPDFRPYKSGDWLNYEPPSFLATEKALLGSDDGVIYVDHVMNLALQAKTRELPDNYPFIVTRKFIKEAIERWSDPSHDLFEAEYAILVERVNGMVEEHFASYFHGGLYHRAKSIVNEVLADCHATTLEKIDWLLEMEATSTFTLNEHYFSDYRQKFLESYRGARAEENRKGDEDLRLEELIARDRYEPALQIMASVRGYFQVSYKRFTDMVPMTIDQELLRGLDWDRGIRGALVDGLEIAGPDCVERAGQYLQEPPDVQSRREDLGKRLERLRLAKRELQSLF
ncbi:P-loop containing nucleoside triphosphate hydrolase protein [Thelephora terrestris]|uniref:P-loop containing nucleoside triphosphate hydrolase protein n=1 Tax=Thelephora terrestris TaxID=56493 RepID=A0A9P6HCG5_9AGAM|nr:P-loop containing nucleoside triphosphate hydrolase protein [Thelephora terrestris]